MAFHSFERRAPPSDIAAGRFGIGDLGPSAFEFIDLLASAGQRLWQVLPLGPTGYGDSPYQCFSAFAGNPLLISLERLIEDGLLTESEARRPARLPTGRRRLPGRDRPPSGALAASARSLRRGGVARRCAIASTASAARTRAGWTTSRCSWPSRRRTVTSPGRRGSPTSRSAIHRRSRAGRPAALERSGCTS